MSELSAKQQQTWNGVKAFTGSPWPKEVERMSIQWDKSKDNTILAIASRLEELESALRLNLAIGPDDPILIDPLEKQVSALTAENGEFKEELGDIEGEHRDTLAERDKRIEELTAERDELRQTLKAIYELWSGPTQNRLTRDYEIGSILSAYRKEK